MLAVQMRFRLCASVFFSLLFVVICSSAALGCELYQSLKIINHFKSCGLLFSFLCLNQASIPSAAAEIQHC